MSSGAGILPSTVLIIAPIQVVLTLGSASLAENCEHIDKINLLKWTVSTTKMARSKWPLSWETFI